MPLKQMQRYHLASEHVVYPANIISIDANSVSSGKMLRDE